MSFSDKLKNTWKKFKRFQKSHPIQLVVMLIGLGILCSQLVVVWNSKQQQYQATEYIQSLKTLNLSELSQKAESGDIRKILTHEIETGTWMYPQTKNYLEIVDKNDNKFAFEKSSSGLLGDDFSKMIFNASKSNNIVFGTGNVIVPSSLSGILTTAAFLFCILMLITYGQKLTAEVLGGHSFKASKPDMDTTLDDVIGYDNVKRQLRELKDQLTHPAEYAKQGVHPPKGILFTGDPGVGKTMMAKAFANELGADFFTCTGADFVEMYVGVGAKRARTLFKLARMSKVAVIFIDEIDALGSRENMGNDTERLSTLNAILAEMDGINQNGHLVVIGATNYAQRLDKALTRPGRFDHTVNIPLPDATTREGILKRYLEGVKHDSSIDLKALSLRTNGYSGAQLKNMVLEATRLAARKNGIQDDWMVTERLLQQAQEITILGISERQSEGEDLVRVAVHELGHALVGYLKCPDLFVEKVTVNGLGNALGYAFSRPVDNKQLTTRREMENRLMMMMAGRASEEVVFQDITGGAADDIYRANELAKQMVCDFGMGATSGFVRPNMDIHGKPEITASIKHDIETILETAYTNAKQLVDEHKEWVQKNTQTLMQRGILMHDELFEGLKRETTANEWLDNMVKEFNETSQKLG